MENHHLQKSISSGKELPHDDLENRLALQLLLFICKLDFKLADKGGNGIFLGLPNSVEDLEDWIKDELVERTLEGLAFVFSGLGPLLSRRIEVVVALVLVSLRKKPMCGINLPIAVPSSWSYQHQISSHT
jgi:hypothetical protein